MSHFEDITGALPAPRDDEPANLRRDILDELSDHLECALRREQLTGGLMGAEGRVLDKFGSPAAVARKLWRDALWEKIMSQRLMLGLCAAMMLVCCAALGLTATWLNRQESLFQAWQTANDARLKEQGEMFTKMLANSEARSKELATQITQSQEQAAKSQFSEWNPVEISFRRGSETGPPVEGVTVALARQPGVGRGYSPFGAGVQPASGDDIPTVGKTSADDGIARFERVKYGTYDVRCQIKESFFSYDTTVVALPGETVKQTIVVPAVVPQMRDVRVVINWPEEIQKLEPQLFCGEGGLLVGEVDFSRPIWRAQPPMLPASPNGYQGEPFSIGSDGAIQRCRIESRGDQIENLIRSRLRSAPAIARLKADLPFALVSPPRGNEFKTIQWPGEGFRFSYASVVFPKTGVELAKILAPSPSRSNSGRPTSPSFGEFDRGSTSNAQENIERLRLSSNQFSMADWGYQFDAASGTLTLTPSQATLEILRPAATNLESQLAAAVSEFEQQQAKVTADLAKAEADRAAQTKKPVPFSEWNPVEITFRKGNKDGAPTPGVEVKLRHSRGSFQRGADAADDIPEMAKTSDADGKVRFEHVRYGTYRATITMKDAGLSMSTTVSALPGEAYSRIIPTPDNLPDPQPTKVRIEWPEDLNALEPVLSIQNWLMYGSGSPQEYWQCYPGLLKDGDTVLVDAEGHVRKHVNPAESASVLAGVTKTWGGTAQVLQEHTPLRRWVPTGESHSTLNWPGAGYRAKQGSIVFAGLRAPLREAFAPMDDANAGVLTETSPPRFQRWENDNRNATPVKLEELRLTLPVDLENWRYEFSLEPTRTLKLTPNEESLKLIRTSLTTAREQLATIKTLRVKESAASKAATISQPGAASDKKTAPFSEWNPVEIRLVEERADGPAAAGYPVTFNAVGPDKSGFPDVQSNTDANGRLRFERVRYGYYLIGGDSKRGDSWSKQLTVLPGESLTKMFVVPKARTELPVKFQVDWPNDLKDRKLAVSISQSRFVRSIHQPDGNPLRFDRAASISKNGNLDSIFLTQSDGSTLAIWAQQNQVGQVGPTGWSPWVYNPDDAKSVGGTPWPGKEWKPKSIAVWMKMPDEISKQWVESLRQTQVTDLRSKSDRSDMVREFDAQTWEQTWQDGTPPVVAMKPDDLALKAIRQMIADTEKAQKLTETSETK